MQYDKKNSYELVPILTSLAGSCLTIANLEDVGVKAASFYLSDLLMKPGLAVLEALSDIRSYYKWPHIFILNATLPPPNREGVYTIRSIYDGGIIQIDLSSLFKLICKLKPEKVILPIGSGQYFQQFWQFLPENTMPYFHISENVTHLPDYTGNYLIHEANCSESSLIKQIKESERPWYIMGDVDFSLIKSVSTPKYGFLETDKPAKDGMQGLVYSFEGTLNILDESMMNSHTPIDERCQCPTCIQALTRAYHHHLLQQTPLLSQRFLIQHNLYTSQN